MIKENVVQQFIKVNEGGEFSGELTRKPKKNETEIDVSFHSTIK